MCFNPYHKSFKITSSLSSLSLSLSLSSFPYVEKPLRDINYLVDINHNKFTNDTSGLYLAMDDHIFYEHQVPFDPIYSYNTYPLQAHESSSLTQLLTPKPPINHQIINQGNGEEEEEEEEELGAMKEMMYKIAAMQPVDIDPATIRKPKRRNVRISDDPQSVAARHRREKISEKIRILQRLVPGGTKLDTASMLDEAIRYVKFLKRQIRELQSNHNPPCGGIRACLGGEDWPIISPYHGHELNFGSSSRGNN